MEADTGFTMLIVILDIIESHPDLQEMVDQALIVIFRHLLKNSDALVEDKEEQVLLNLIRSRVAMIVAHGYDFILQSC
jgi:hypothetical protein